MALSQSIRAQMWYTDFFIGSLILFTMVAIFFVNIQHLEASQSSRVQIMIQEGSVISDQLMTPGFPSGWTNSTVTQLGIVDGARVNFTQLDALKATNYSTQRKLLKLVDDYAFFFENKTEMRERRFDFIRTHLDTEQF